MPVTTLTVQKIVNTGLEPAYAAANADGSYVPNNGRVFLHVKNGSVDTPCTVTIVTPYKVDGLDIADREVVVPFPDAGPPAESGERLIPLGSPEIYGSQTLVQFDVVADVTIAAIQL